MVSNLQSFKVSNFRKCKLSEHTFSTSSRCYILAFDFSKYFGAFEIKNNSFGESWSRPPSPETMKMMGVRVFLKWILKVTNPNWSRISQQSFLAILSRIFTIEMTPDPQIPNPHFFSNFHGFLQEICFFSASMSISVLPFFSFFSVHVFGVAFICPSSTQHIFYFLKNKYLRLGGAQPGNRFVSFVRTYARSGCLAELDLKFHEPAFSLFPLVPG